MTSTEQLAARWLADVPKHKVVFRNGALCLPTGNWPDHALTPVVALPDALAAIARHLAPGDDLVERLQQAFVTCRPMNGSNDLDNAASAISDAIARIAALTATVAEADVVIQKANEHLDSVKVARDMLGNKWEAAEAEAATMRDRLVRMEGERDDALSAAQQQDRLREATLATLRGVSADLEASETTAARFLDALTPSADTKAAYMGEFSIPFPTVDENGDEVMLRPNVPWTTIKEIMAAIRARAALTDGGSNG